LTYAKALEIARGMESAFIKACMPTTACHLAYVASAPAIFQKLMETVLQGIPGVCCYIDDILVSTSDEESHIQILEQVFTCLTTHGFKLKLEKFEFPLKSMST